MEHIETGIERHWREEEERVWQECTQSLYQMQRLLTSDEIIRSSPMGGYYTYRSHILAGIFSGTIGFM
jgi:hypothetical protein